MIALQYIYTSWKNGDSSEKGYMIYSKSDGISETECDDIKFVMQYVAPKEMVPNPTPEQIANELPYSFSYFKLSSGRVCVAQSTYLGKDYSGRFGNYIIYALVLPIEDLDKYPVEIFGEDYIKTFMTEAELNASSPVPALPPLDISETGSVINDEQVMEFIYDREEEFAYLISAVLAAKDKEIPFYLNDTRENLVLWVAALQKMLPIEIAKQVTFSTYVGNHEKFRSDECKAKGLDLTCIGVRPDANYFNYLAESNSSRQIVMDFIGGNMTNGIKVLSMAKAMASSYTLGMDDINLFSEFLTSVGFHEFNMDLEAAYNFYRLYKEGEYTPEDGSLIKMLTFGCMYCPDEMNADIGVKIIEKIQAEMWDLTLDESKVLIPYLYSYSGFMVYTVHDILFEMLYQYAMGNKEEKSLFSLLDTIHSKNQDEYKGFLNYFNSSEVIGQSKLYLEGNQSPNTNLFYAKFIVDNYQFRNGLNDSMRVVSLLNTIFENVGHFQNVSEMIIQILNEVQNSSLLISDIISKFVNNFGKNQLTDFGTKFGQWIDGLDEGKAAEIQTNLLSNKNASRLAIYLCSMYIAQSKNPEKAFWGFYNQQKYLFTADVNLDLGTAIIAYLERDPTLKATFKIIENVDFKLIKDISAVKMIIGIIEDIPIKSLIKTDYKVLEKVANLAFNNRCEGIASKTIAVLFAKYCEKQIGILTRKKSLQELSADFKLSLKSFEKKDFQEYVSEYLIVFVKCLRTTEDVRMLLHSSYNPKYFGIFNDEYISILKKLEKKEERIWNRLIALTCIYLIENEITDDVAAAYEPLFIKYLRKYDPEELSQVKLLVLQELKVGKSTDFFERIYEKEGLRDKLSGFFTRKI